MGGGGLIVPLQQSKWVPTMHPSAKQRMEKVTQPRQGRAEYTAGLTLCCMKCVQSYVETISNSTCHIHIEDQWCEESFSDSYIAHN